MAEDPKTFIFMSVHTKFLLEKSFFNSNIYTYIYIYYNKLYTF